MQETTCCVGCSLGGGLKWRRTSKPSLYRTLPTACLHAPERCTMHQMLKPAGTEAVLHLLQQNQHEISGKAIEAKAAVPKTSGNGLVPANRKMFVGGTVSLRAERSGQPSCTLMPNKRTRISSSVPRATGTCRQCCWQHFELCPLQQFSGGMVQLGLVTPCRGWGRDGPAETSQVNASTHLTGRRACLGRAMLPLLGRVWGSAIRTLRACSQCARHRCMPARTLCPDPSLCGCLAH